MTTAQKLEKAFLLNVFTLVNEVQGRHKLTSQFHSKQRSVWVKQNHNPKQKKDALSRV